MWKSIKKLFGGLEMTWAKTIILAIILGIYTAIVAMFAPDGSSFHDIAVTPEWWVLPAIIIIVNCKTPLDAALKTFVFFLISQPLVYLIQVPFNDMGWGLFGYYKYWFKITLLTFPGGFIGWFIKKDKWYSGIILAVMTAFLGLTGVGYVHEITENFPNHLLSIIYCFGIIPIFIFALFKDKLARILCAAITVIVVLVYVLMIGLDKPYETYNNIFIEENNITFVGKPEITYWSSTSGAGDVTIVPNSDPYTLKITGTGTSKYYFTITDDVRDYDFEYYFDKDQQTVIVNLLQS